jgi:hypothetical protein
MLVFGLTAQSTEDRQISHRSARYDGFSTERGLELRLGFSHAQESCLEVLFK